MSRYPKLDERDGAPRLFGNRPYCSKEAQEMLNQESRDIFRENPDYVSDPTEPTMDEVLEHIRERQDGVEDADLIVELLGEGLDWEEVIVYYLFRWSGLDKREIYYATEGIRTAPDVEERDLTRHIDAVLRRVEGKLDVDLVDDGDSE